MDFLGIYFLTSALIQLSFIPFNVQCIYINCKISGCFDKMNLLLDQNQFHHHIVILLKEICFVKILLFPKDKFIDLVYTQFIAFNSLRNTNIQYTFIHRSVSFILTIIAFILITIHLYYLIVVIKDKKFVKKQIVTNGIHKLKVPIVSQQLNKIRFASI